MIDYYTSKYVLNLYLKKFDPDATSSMTAFKVELVLVTLSICNYFFFFPQKL